MPSTSRCRDTNRGPFHPLFAKLLIAPFVGLLGLHRVAWRLPVLLVGALVVAAIAAAAWLASGSRRLTALARLLCGFDGLTFVTGRLALLEFAATLCVAIMLLGLIGVHRSGGWAETGADSWAPLTAIGAAGIGLATKWSLAPAALACLVRMVGPIQRRLHIRMLAAAGATLAAMVIAMTLAWGPAVGDLVSSSAHMATYAPRAGRPRARAGVDLAVAVVEPSDRPYAKECRGNPASPTPSAASGPLAKPASSPWATPSSGSAGPSR
jgi:4-amino-4-deoxy-L-arabinose transferase-like glycosyltransferase